MDDYRTSTEVLKDRVDKLEAEVRRLRKNASDMDDWLADWDANIRSLLQLAGGRINVIEDRALVLEVRVKDLESALRNATSRDEPCP